ncbi:MAG: type III polyketide synthase [Roseivirga sp.]|nr:type III polyketide synthase [Roseivirga sp.]
MSTIQSIGTALPENSIDQRRIAEFMSQAHGFDSDRKNKLLALYRASGISQRHSVIADYSSLDQKRWTFYPHSKDLRPFPSTGERSKLYRKHALNLSLRAIENCLEKLPISNQEITHIITVSCTGMYAPGLDIDLVKSLGLSTSVQRTSINFMGCYAALTAMKGADAICKSQPKAKVLVVATELCTIHFQNKTDDDNLLANAIFSDGSAAMLVTNQSHKYGRDPVLSPKAFHCDLLTDGEKDMAWNIGDFGFEMRLSAYVPDLVQSGIKSLVNSLTGKLSNAEIKHYAIHPGGKKILSVIEEELGIEKSANHTAHKVLREYGNMSSPTVLFVLKGLLEGLNEKNKGDNVLSLAFGPGLTLESILFEVT